MVSPPAARVGRLVAPRQSRDQQSCRRRDQVVEHHEPGAPVAVEKRTGDRRHDETWRDGEERGQAGQLRRVVSREDEQDQRDGDHLAAHPSDEKAAVEVPEAAHAQERAVPAGWLPFYLWFEADVLAGRDAGAAPNAHLLPVSREGELSQQRR